MKHIFLAAISLTALFGFTAGAAAITVTTDAGAGPESITATPDGGLILGSANTPFIYRAGKGETKAKKFIDVSGDGPASFLGVLADASTNTLWACETITPPTEPKRRTVLRSFDLKTGAPKMRWPLPGDTNVCNDFSIAPDHSLYVSDTFGVRIYRVRPGAATGELVLENRALDGIDGIAFLDGQLYVNNVFGNTIWRIPLDANGKAGDPVPIWLDQQIKGPDGMRAANGKLFVAENRNGRDSMLTIHGDTAHVTVIETGLKLPTAIDPAGNLLWVGDRATDKAFTIPMPK